MAAIRGMGSGFPCPVCLASSEEMPALEGGLELRSTEKMKSVYDTAEEEPTAAEREKDLKAAGLRRVEVSRQLVLFILTIARWLKTRCRMHFGQSPSPTPMLHFPGIVSTPTTVVYSASMFSRSSSRFSRTLRLGVAHNAERLALVSRKSRTVFHFGIHRTLTLVLTYSLQDMPRWRDLAHFTHISEFNEYCDGRKYEDLSKVCVGRSYSCSTSMPTPAFLTVTTTQIIIFASHCIFPESNERGYQWLALARSYLELDMWSSLRNHTTTTIRMGRQELRRFDREAKVRHTPHGYAL
jgi:hypothetical protein